MVAWRAWQLRRPQVAAPTRDAAFLRRELAIEADLRAGVAFPVLVDDRAFCVIEYFSTTSVADLAALLETLASVGASAGQFVLRKRFEAELRESERSLEFALDSGGAASWDWDVRADKRRWTRFSLLYGPPEGIADTHAGWLECVHPEDRERVALRMANLLETGDDEWNEIYRIVHPERGIRVLSGLGRAIRDAAGRVERVTGIDLDVTERVEVEEALKEADRRKDELLATLAHELRNPLAPIRNALHLLGIDKLSEPQRAEARAMIQRQVEHMVRLVDDLLDVSRISSGKITLRAEQVDIGAVVARALETGQPLLASRGVGIVVEAPEAPIVVSGDLARLVQVVGNILHNAAKYPDRGGQVRVSVERDGDDAVIRVTDTGISIAPQMLPLVFDLFVQDRDFSSRSDSGLGIGLALAKRLVEMHRGSISAASDGVGKGSTFTVRLPALAGAAARDAAAPRDSAPALGDSAPRILIADDNEDAAESLAMYLELRGHEVKVAHDGVDAVELAETFLPGIAILDIGMPASTATRRRGASARPLGARRSR